MRPHAFRHTWSPGYELPAGMLHGHAVGTCMGYGSYLAMLEGYLTETEFHRIMKLINDLELALWHDIMDNHDLVYAANKKAYSKRGGNLCAPVPKTIGACGYINELSRERLDQTVDEYKAICQTYARGGKGIDVLCADVGLEDPSVTAGDALKGLPNQAGANANEQPRTYNQWIEQMQTGRNKDWEMNVTFQGAPDTEKPPTFNKFSLFEEGVEKYAME